MKTFTIVKALIVNEKGEVLFLRRSQTDDRRPGQWDFPGGNVDAGEDLRQAVLREAREEAGIDLQDPQVVFGYSEPRPPHGYPTWIVFVDHVTGQPPVTLSHEHDGSMWATPADMLKEITYDLHRNVLAYVTENNLLTSGQATVQPILKNEG